MANLHIIRSKMRLRHFLNFEEKCRAFLVDIRDRTSSALFRAGLLKVNRIIRSAPSSHFRCMSNEAFQLYFFGKLSLTFAYLSENPESLIIWNFEKKEKKRN